MVGFALPVATASLITAQVLGQPKQAGEDRNASFTAFPEIKVPMKEVDRGARKELVPDYDKLFARFVSKHPRPIAPNAPPLVQVRTAQVNEGVLYLVRMRTRIEIGQYRSESLKGGK
jgi:hypothetical protein